jgi:hypothetical protein
MSAEEMFKKLGFIKAENSNHFDERILYQKVVTNGPNILSVEFKNGYVVYTDCAGNCMRMTSKLISAIDSQCEELGWED